MSLVWEPWCAFVASERMPSLNNSQMHRPDTDGTTALENDRNEHENEDNSSECSFPIVACLGISWSQG